MDASGAVEGATPEDCVGPATPTSKSEGGVQPAAAEGAI